MRVQRPENYLISDETYYLKTKITDERNHTFIMDERGVYDCPKSVTRILRSSCRLNGITLERMKAQSKRFFQDNVHKQPLVLAYTTTNQPVVFFSTYSARSTNNIWINCNAVINISSNGTSETIVTFPSFEQLVLPIQYQAFCGLYVRALFYQKHLRKELPTPPTKQA